MNILIIIDKIITKDKKSLITFDFARQCDYIEFANCFNIDSILYDAISPDYKINSSFVQIENCQSELSLCEDGYYYLNIDLLKDAKMRFMADSLLCMASFDVNDIDFKGSEQLFTKYTGIPYWLWPKTKLDWGFSQEEMQILANGVYELKTHAHDILNDTNSNVLIISCWDRETILSVLQMDKDDILKYDAIVCVSAYLSHIVYCILCWLKKLMTEERIWLIHNNLADVTNTKPRVLHQNQNYSIYIAPYTKCRKESRIIVKGNYNCIDFH